MSLLPPKWSRVLIAAIILECVVIGALWIRRWVRHDVRTSAVVGVEAPETERPAGPPPSSRGSSNPGPAQDPRPSLDGNPTAEPRSGPGAAPVDPAIPAGTEGRERSDGGPPAPAADEPRIVTGESASGGWSGGALPAQAQGGAPVRPGAGGMNGGGTTEPAGATAGGSRSQASGQPAFVARGTEGTAVPLPLPGTAPAERDAGDPDKTDPVKDAEDEPDTPEEEEAGEDRSGADNTPPVLQSLRFDPPQVEGGSVVTLTVQASDAKSGLKSIWGEVRSPNRSATLSFGSSSLPPGTVFTFRITLPPTAQTGTWYVAWISLTDGAANAKLIQAPSASAAPPGGTFAAFSSESDATPPEVLQVWFDKSAVGPGEMNAIVVQARDDRSGIASVRGACQSPSKSALVWFTGVMNADAGTWVGNVAIPNTADCGEWVVQQLAVKDTAGNTTLLQADSPLLGRAGFRVSSGSDCDFSAPTLERFDVAPAFVVSGTATEVIVTARVYDEGSGAAFMSGWFEGPVPAGGQAPKLNFTCSPDPRDPEAPWIGRIQVQPTAARGTWKVGSIRLEDKAKNARTYSSAEPLVSGHVFQVQ